MAESLPTPALEHYDIVSMIIPISDRHLTPFPPERLPIQMLSLASITAVYPSHFYSEINKSVRIIAAQEKVEQNRRLIYYSIITANRYCGLSTLGSTTPLEIHTCSW